jgi:hypothetical protein
MLYSTEFLCLRQYICFLCITVTYVQQLESIADLDARSACRASKVSGPSVDYENVH